MGSTVTGPNLQASDVQTPDMWWRGRAREDASAIVGLQTPRLLIGAVVVWAGFLALGLSGGHLDRPGLYAVAFVGIGAAWAVALRAPGSPMIPVAAAAVIVLESLAVVGVLIAVEPVERGPLMPCAGAIAIIGALLCLRGRVDAAWVSFIASTAAIGVTGGLHGGSLDYVVIMAPGNLGVLVLMTVFAAVIGPRAEQIFALRRQARRDAAAVTVRAVRDQQLARLDGRVRSLLEEIAAGDVLDEEGLERCRLVEAQLRDRIRAAGLDVPALAEAAWAARSRGVNVLLLDDYVPGATTADEQARERLLASVHAAAVDALDAARPGCDVTVRLLPTGRAAAATVSVADDGAVSLQEFS